MKTEIRKTRCGADVATLSLPMHKEHVITVQATEAAAMSRCLRQTAEERGAVILSQFVFAGTHHYQEFRREVEQIDWPAVWLQGDACTDGNLYSMQAVALTGLNPQPVRLNGRNMGFLYEDETARYCRLHGMIPQNLSASRVDQTRSVFDTMDAALQSAGFRFTDTVRTWIYLDHLLEWYDDFNIVRTNYFNKTGVFEHMVPASTGIGASNPYGAAIMMDVLAVQSKDGRLAVREVISPLQNPAIDYKSSFSRAVEMTYPNHKNLLISGTASIDPNGKTVHLNDPEKQIRLTMDVIFAILESRGMGWNDLFRGIAYFKDMDFRPIYEKVAGELGIPRFPLAISHAAVCRHDLLFEIEVDAVKIL